MFRISVTARAVALITTLLVSSTGSPALAQTGYTPPKRFEITPFGSYQWGGSFDTQGFSNILAGEIHEQASFSWGGILSFLAAGNSAVELYYLRQDTDVEFEPNGGQKREVGTGFSNNYIQLGVRQGLPRTEGISPFITASMGINVLDAKDSDSSTRFAWSLGGGLKYMVPDNPRLGFRLDVKWMVTPVPSGTYGTWCDYWGCYVTSGTDWLHQGSAGLGLVLAF
jgi:opacity protein-like surface antigen